MKNLVDSDSYDMGNTPIRQLWWTREQIDSDELGKQLGIQVVTVSSILQPGNSIPYTEIHFSK